MRSIEPQLRRRPGAAADIDAAMSWIAGLAAGDPH